MAKVLNVPNLGVHVDGAGTGGVLPAGLPHHRTIAWKWPLIAAAIHQMVGEGKNA